MKPNHIEPTLEEWRALYAAAEQFKNIKCWEWLYDSDLFGVREPQTGVVAYCSVLGNAGEMFALTVYPGDEALESFWKIVEGEVGVGDLEVFVTRHCLEASFGPRNHLEKRDLALVKQLGLQFRGATGWTYFRSHLPDCAPWFLNDAEARLLTFALQKATEIALWAKDNPDKLVDETDDEKVLVFDWTGGTRSETWVTPKRRSAEELRVLPPPADTAQLEQIRALNCQRPEAWEAAIFPLPFPMGEKDERPFFSYTMLCVMEKSGFLLGAPLASPHSRAAEFQNEFFKIAKTAKVLPQEVRVANQETYDLFEPLGKELGFKVKWAKRCPRWKTRAIPCWR